MAVHTSGIVRITVTTESGSIKMPVYEFIAHHARAIDWTDVCPEILMPVISVRQPSDYRKSIALPGEIPAYSFRNDSKTTYFRTDSTYFYSIHPAQ